MSPRLSELFLRSQSDERLVALARGGHDPAFAAIVERYRRQLLALAWRLNSDGRAEDIVQQAFLAALAALRSGAEVRHLRGWLHRIVRNAAIQTATRTPLDAAHGETDDGGLSADVTERHVLALTALVEVSRLPDRQREAFVGTAIQGRARSDVARTMGLSEGAVRQLVYRARSTLRQGLTALTPYPIAEWLASGRTGGLAIEQIGALAAGAGTASTAGIALKVSAVLATGVIAAGVAVSRAHHHHAPSRAAALVAPTAAHPVHAVPDAAAARPDAAVAVAAASPMHRVHPQRTAPRPVLIAWIPAAATPAAPTAIEPSLVRRHHDRAGGRGRHRVTGSGSLAPVVVPTTPAEASAGGGSGQAVAPAPSSLLATPPTTPTADGGNPSGGPGGASPPSPGAPTGSGGSGGPPAGGTGGTPHKGEDGSETGDGVAHRDESDGAVGGGDDVRGTDSSSSGAGGTGPTGATGATGAVGSSGD